MKIKGLVTLFFILSQTAILNREYISSGITQSSATFWNHHVSGNGFGFDLGLLDLMLICLCFAVAWVNNERNKLNEAYRQRFNAMKTKYLEEEQKIAQLDAYMEGCRGAYSNIETPLRKVTRNLASLQYHLELNLVKLEKLCDEFEELKTTYQKQTQSYPRNQAKVLKSLTKQRFEIEIRCLKEYIEREVIGLNAEINLTLQCING